MKWIATLSLALVALGFSVAKDDKPDDEKIQGKWQLTKAELNGENAPEDFVKGFNITFTKSKFEYRMADGGGEEGDFKLDPTAKPNATASFTTGGETRKAIYKWDGDNFQMCVSEKGGDTPKEYAGKDGNIFFVLKKAK